MKRDLQLYTTALERHKPVCCLRDAASSSSLTTPLSLSPSADCKAASSPPGVPPQASASTQAAAPSPSTSLTSSVGSPHLSSSTPAPTTVALSADPSSEVFTSSSLMTVPYSVSFSTPPAAHSLFSNDPPSLITSMPTNVPSSSLSRAAQPQSRQGAIDEGSPSADACFSTLHPGALDAFLMKQASFLTASSNVVPHYSHAVAENTALVAQGFPMTVPQLHPGHFRGNQVDSSSPPSLLTPTLQDPALQSLSVSLHSKPEPAPVPAFSSKPSYTQHVGPNPVSLLSMLTVPSPLNESQTTSGSFNGPLSQPTPWLPPLVDPSRDLSLSELLEVNDWILQ